MKFEAAFAYMKRGHDVALPEWGGFWRWDDALKTVVMHTRHGGTLDMRDSDNMDYTLGFTFRDDWQLVKNADNTEHAANQEINA